MCDLCFHQLECNDKPNAICVGYKPWSGVNSKTQDNVNHPTHYNQGNIECIDAMISAFGAEKVAVFCRINAFKYVWRMANKNGLEDAKKAVWYLNKHIELKERMADDSD